MIQPSILTGCQRVIDLMHSKGTLSMAKPALWELLPDVPPSLHEPVLHRLYRDGVIRNTRTHVFMLPIATEYAERNHYVEMERKASFDNVSSEYGARTAKGQFDTRYVIVAIVIIVLLISFFTCNRTR